MSHATGVKTAPAPKPSTQASQTRPTPEEIRQRAYEIYDSRHGAPGDELEDWLQAERELLCKHP
jgi:hypothetical protein